MLRTKNALAALTTLALAALTMAGCADVPSKEATNSYCTVGTGNGCPSLEGSGDCQPCPEAALRPASAPASSVR